jgi:hypothetical protein
LTLFKKSNNHNNDKNGSSSLLPPSFVAAVDGLNVAVKGGHVGTFEQNVLILPAIRKGVCSHLTSCFRWLQTGKYPCAR